MKKQFLVFTRSALLAAIVAFVLAACGSSAAAPTSSNNVPPTAAVKATPPAIATAASVSTSVPAPAPTTGQPYAPVIDPANFVTSVDNPYFPLKPGTTYIYEGKTEKGDEHVEVNVGPDTKVIMGITCVAVDDTVTVDGQLEEGTIDWYAQDKQGNVWYFGEDTKEYKDGKVSSTKGAWEAGVDGALPGIIMQANPSVGDKYRQEYYKGQAEDMASVLSLSESAAVPTGSYSNVLVTKEWTALDAPPVYEQKYYAKGVGNILTKGVEGGWELPLVEIRHR